MVFEFNFEREYFRSIFFRRLEINFLEHASFLPARALENSAAIFHHVRMAAQISRRVRRLQSPLQRVLSHQIIHASRLAAPLLVFPRTADRRNVLEPWNLRSKLFHLFAITKLPAAASALNAKKFVIPRHRRISRFPVFIKRSHITHKRRKARNGGEQEMIRSSAFQIESEASFGNLSAQQRVARMQFVKMRSQISLRHKFDEKLQAVFVRRRNNRIRPLDSFSVVVYTERRILPRDKFKRPARVDANQPQILAQVFPLQNFRNVVFVARRIRLRLGHDLSFMEKVKLRMYTKNKTDETEASFARNYLPVR